MFCHLFIIHYIHSISNIVQHNNILYEWRIWKHFIIITAELFRDVIFCRHLNIYLYIDVSVTGLWCTCFAYNLHMFLTIYVFLTVERGFLFLTGVKVQKPRLASNQIPVIPAYSRNFQQKKDGWQRWRKTFLCKKRCQCSSVEKGNY